MRFELAWRGGATAARLHQRRPGADALPWGTLAGRDQAPSTMLEARAVWSTGVFTEYASAAAFSALTTALLECGAPVDLAAMSADIAVDELFHVELSARLVAELGGAVPLAFDVAHIAPVTPGGTRPVMRAARIAVTTSCVGEALSVPAIARSRALANEPLIHAVLERLLADEGPHARLGFWILDWAADRLTDSERAELAQLALEALEVYAPVWQQPGAPGEPGARDLRTTITQAIAAPLARHGIVLDPARLATLLAA